MMLLEKAIKKSPNFFNKMEDEDSINIYDSDSFLDLLDSDDYESNPTSKQQLQQKSQTPSAVTADSEGKIGEFRHGIVSKLLEKFEIIFTAGTFYLYDDEYGYYIEHGEDSLNARIEEEFEDPAKNSIFLTKEATAELKRNTLVKKGFEFNPSREYINFEDFVYNIKTGEILNHSPDFALNYVVPAKIRSRSSYMPNFLKFVDTLCEGDESKIARLQEFLGVLLSPLQPKNAFFFIGVHDCGKTTLSNFVEELIGEDFVSNVPLDAFDKHFEFSQIFGKRLNNLKSSLGTFLIKRSKRIKAFSVVGKSHRNNCNGVYIELYKVTQTSLKLFAVVNTGADNKLTVKAKACICKLFQAIIFDK